MSIDFEPLHVALSVARVLDRCGLRYVVGGSLASSVSGEPRSTRWLPWLDATRKPSSGPPPGGA